MLGSRLVLVLVSLIYSALAHASPQSLLRKWNLDGQAVLEQQWHPDFDINLAELRLVEVEGIFDPVWITELEKINLKAQDIGFVDITDTRDLGSKICVDQASFPTPDLNEVVKTVIKNLSTAGPIENLETFSSFRTRDYRSATGKQSQKWLLARVSNITTEWASESLQDFISIKEFLHPWGQNSIVAKINGSSDTADGIVVLSAHQDSTNRLSPFLPAPGADDDGSGTVAILEVYRALLAADFRPSRSVEFHWYAAEEGGLLGSRAVVLDYSLRSVGVAGVLHFDTIGTIPPGTEEAIGFVGDLTNYLATNFSRQLVDLYCDIPSVVDDCGYGCSDHASWNASGYPSASLTGAAFSAMRSGRKVHTPNDRTDDENFSFNHILEFSKLGVAFAIELAGWPSKE